LTPTKIFFLPLALIHKNFWLRPCPQTTFMILLGHQKAMAAATGLSDSLDDHF
jgi:hypothetical protein